MTRERKLHSRIVRNGVVVFICVAASVVMAAEPSPEIDVRGMTFVASRADNNAVILRADRARFDPDDKLAYLRDVDAEVPPATNQRGFRMWCDASVVDLATNDFEATGNVHGYADSGEEFVAEWVRYDHSRGVLFTDAPVTIVDRGTTVEGGGFDYEIDERKFKLRGGAKVVQDRRPDTEREKKESVDGAEGQVP